MPPSPEFIIGPAFGRTRWRGHAFPENALAISSAAPHPRNPNQEFDDSAATRTRDHGSRPISRARALARAGPGPAYRGPVAVRGRHVSRTVSRTGVSVQA